MKDDHRDGRPTTSRTNDNITAIDKIVKEDRKVTSWLIADTLGILKTVVLWILREDLKKRKLCARFGSNNSTFSDSKTSLNIEPPPILARFVSLRLFPVPEGEDAAEGCKFDTIEGIQKPVTDQLNNISAEDFSNAMKKL